MLGGSLDETAGPVGILMVTGGTQTRIGSHRMFERLAAGLSQSGHACFRFDRRGVGDSEGEDAGFEGSRDDLLAAAAAFRAEMPGLKRLYGFGLCDGATALALFGAEAGLEGLVLANPWLVEAAADAPPPAYIRRHYRQSLLSAGAWRRALTGRMSYRKAIAGLGRAVRPPAATLAGRVRDALGRTGLPAVPILAAGDPTAIAAAAEWKARPAAPLPIRVETDSHTFAREGDCEALLNAVLKAITVLEARG